MSTFFNFYAHLDYRPRTGGVTTLPGVGNLTLTGYAPTAIMPLSVTPEAGSLALTGYAPTTTATNNHIVLPGVGALTLTGYDPTTIEVLYSGQDEGVAFSGFGTEFLILTDADQTILYNYRGWGGIQKSTDFGDTWVYKNIDYSPNNTYPFQAFARDTVVAGRTWAFPYRSATREMYVTYSDDYFETFTWWGEFEGRSGWPSGYIHGIAFDLAGDFLFGRGANLVLTKQLTAQANVGEPNDAGNHVSLTAVLPPTTQVATWQSLRLGDSMFLTYGSQGEIPDDARIYPQDLSSEGLVWGNSVVEGRKYWGNGLVVVGTRSNVSGLLTLDVIQETTTATPFPTTSIQFPEDIIGETAAYGGGQWVVTAVANADNSRILIAVGDPLTDTWVIKPSVQSPVVLSDYLYRQLYYNNGNGSFLLAQATVVGTTQYMNLIKLGNITGVTNTNIPVGSLALTGYVPTIS